jgi:protein TonB
MKKIVLFLAMYLCTAIIAFCQKKTVTEYYDKDWNIVSSKENAAYYEVVESNSEQERVHGVIYYISGAKHSEGDYQSSEIRLKEGIWKEWYELGMKREELTFQKGNIEGLRTIWYENGNKEIEANYKNGKVDGIEKGWYESGQLHYEIELPNGQLKVYFENGNLSREAKYVSNKETEGTCYSETDKNKAVACDTPFFRLAEPVKGMAEVAKFVGQTLKYPKEARKKKIEGKVFVSFIIAEDGTITNVEVIKGVHPLLDNEAARVIALMPKWIPGIYQGKNVKIRYTLPISFKLS